MVSQGMKRRRRGHVPPPSCFPASAGSRPAEPTVISRTPPRSCATSASLALKGAAARGAPSTTAGKARLLCTINGCPLAVEAIDENRGGPAMLSRQVQRGHKRFGINHIAMVGDNDTLTMVRIRENLSLAGVDWISALNRQEVRTLLQKSRPLSRQDTDAVRPPLCPGELVTDQVGELRSADFPGERRLVCVNPRLQAEKVHQRELRLKGTERILEDLAAKVRWGRKPLQNRGAVDSQIDRKLNRNKAGQHFTITVGDTELRWPGKLERIAAEAQLDGIYVVRTNLTSENLSAAAAVETYKSLRGAERAFQTSKGHPRYRMVHANSEDHMRGHVFLCMLAYYVEWHMRRRLAPLLVQDDDPFATRARRDTHVDLARPSDRAQHNGDTKTTTEDFPVHSFPTLMGDLSSLVLNQVSLPAQQQAAITLATKPTKLQSQAFNLLGVKPEAVVPKNMTRHEQ